MNRFIIPLLIVLLIGCPIIFAAPRVLKIEAEPLPDQEVKYIEGREQYISKSENGRVAIVLLKSTYESGSIADFHIFAVNDSDEAFNFSIDNISALCNSVSLKVYDPEEVWQREGEKIRRDYENGRVTLSNSDAAVLGPKGVERAIPLIQKRNQDNEQRTLQRIEELQELSKTLLRKNTIEPKESYGGVVKINAPYTIGKLEIKVEAGVDTHSFLFNITEK